LASYSEEGGGTRSLGRGELKSLLGFEGDENLPGRGKEGQP